MKKVLSVSLLTAVLAGCGSFPSSPPTPQDKFDPGQSSADVTPPTPAANKFSGAGTYEGVYPCADCSGIKVQLILKDNKTYFLKETYQGTKGKGHPSTFTTSGVFSLLTSRDDKIQLDQHSNNEIYLITKDAAQLLGQDPDAKPNKNYVLKKVSQ
ncbi:MAG: copper resistance protein NlpE N-terminal domain-containing protein [Neisseriaceae bacterium]